MKKTLTLPDAFALGLALPDVEQGVFFGLPALKVNGRPLAVTPGHKSAEPNSLALFVPYPRRAELLRDDPDRYYAPHHYQMRPVVLARLAYLTKAELRAILAEAHAFVAARAKKKRPKR